MSFDTNREALELKAAIAEVYALPDIIHRSRTYAHYALSALSAGKPWVDYPGVRERSRLRLVERWRLDAHTREERAGVIKIVLQHIVPGTEEVEGSFLHDAMRLVFEADSNELPNDHWVTLRAKINLLQSGKVIGWLQRSTSDSMVYDEGYPSSLAASMIEFLEMQPSMEQAYSVEELSGFTIASLSGAIQAFAIEEQLLTEQRLHMTRGH